MDKFIDFLRKAGAKTATVVAGPNGKFISVIYKKGVEGRKHYPIGKKSQNGELRDFNVLKTNDGMYIATVNEYEDLETMEL